MASVHHLCVDAHFIARHVLREHHSLNKNARNLYFAAVVIQRTWRGYVVRKMIKRWHQAATTIQRWVRGWLWRWHLPEFYREYLDWFCMRRYHEMATKIQALWRGYCVRKRIGDVRKIRAERERLAEKNRKMMEEMRDAFGRMKQEKEEREIEEMKETVLFVLFKLHHLLRTQSVEGVFSKHGSKQLSFVETLLKALKFKNYMTALREAYNKYYRELQEKNKVEPPYTFEGVNLRNMEEAYRRRDRTKETKQILKEDSPRIHQKPFERKKYVDRRKYERTMFSEDKYVGKREAMLERTFDETKNVSEHDFDLRVLELAEIVEKIPPYYIDLWSRNNCLIHDVPDEKF